MVSHPFHQRLRALWIRKRQKYFETVSVIAIFATLNDECIYSSMLRLKLIHVSKSVSYTPIKEYLCNVNSCEIEIHVICKTIPSATKSRHNNDHLPINTHDRYYSIVFGDLPRQQAMM